MTAFNVVRFKVKPGSEQAFIDAHKRLPRAFKGFIAGNLIRTGDQTFCMVGEWRSYQHLANARPEMIGLLDSFRHLLEDLGSGLGVTDPVSGEVVVRLAVAKPAPERKAPRKGKAKAKAKAKAGAKAKRTATKRRR